MLRAALILLVALVALARPLTSSAESLPGHLIGDHAVRARLSLSGIAAGGSVVATIDLTPAVGWHIYGPEHGDAGAPPDVRWNLPPGVHAGAIAFPPSLRVVTHGLTTFEYHGPTALQIPLAAASGIVPRGGVPIRAVVSWLACSNVCVPGQANVAATLNIVPASTTGFAAVLSFMALAFVGGLVLNLMPCVFPVLSFKALRAIGEPYERRVRTAVAYTAGVTSSCAGLGIALIVARSAGHTLGWGFQLQSPIFVAALAVLMIGLALAMSGFIELTLPIPAPLARRAATAGAFGDGILVTLIASACIAPYMGAALGFALAASAPVAIGIILALGLGIALPHALLMLSPALLYWLPKPGPWLITARRVLALPLYLSAAWLVWVFAQQVLPQNIVPSAVAGSPQAGTATTFSTANLAALSRVHRPVLVEVGAAWCITCQVNERFALDRPEVTTRLRMLGVTVVHADWTSQNPQITTYLRALGAAGVPLYVYYRANGTEEVWPQLLTARAIIERLNRA
jgi:thiol:disulfide interchange protein